MNARTCRLAVLACFFSLSAAPPAAAQSNPIFGLSGAAISPPGVATPADVLTIQLGGTAGFSLVPQNIFVAPLSPGVFMIYLTTPDDVGSAVPTPWNIQATTGPLPPGSYDFNLSGITGFGRPSQFTLGTQLLFDDFLVVPEPAVNLLVAMGLAGLARSRRKPRARAA